MTNQANLFDPIPNPGTALLGKFHHTAPETSAAAAERIMPRSGTKRMEVLRAIADVGRTDEELQHDLRMGANTERPRRVELVEMGWVHDGGKRRKVQSGELAVVWELTPAGRREFEGQVAS